MSSQKDKQIFASRRREFLDSEMLRLSAPKFQAAKLPLYEILLVQLPSIIFGLSFETLRAESLGRSK